MDYKLNNHMKIINHTLLAAALFLVLASIAVISFTQQVAVGDAAEPNMHASRGDMATTSAGIYSAVEIAAEVTARPCASRVITTYTDMSLSFDGDFSPTATVGHLQAGTTTVAYDSAIYGCGAIDAIAKSATSTVSVTTFVF